MWTRLGALIVKELLAAFRDPRARLALIGPPIIQLFLFAYAATLEVSNVPIGVLNQDWGITSEQLISRFERASAFSEIRRYASLGEVKPAIDRQEVMIVVHIGQDFSRKLAAGEPATVQLLLDGRKSNSAQIVNGYVGTIVRQFSEDFREGKAAASEIVDRSWYNPNREYRTAMVPTLIGILSMTMVLMIVGMSVARERELGTFEQLLVSPLQPLEIVIGKAVPGLIVGLAQGVVIALIVIFVFGIPMAGSPLALFSGPRRLPPGGDRRGTLHLLTGRQPAAGDDGDHGVHDALHAAVGLRLAGPEYAHMAAAGGHDQPAHPLHGHHARRVPARHAVLAGRPAHLAHGADRGRDDLRRGMAVPAPGAVGVPRVQLSHEINGEFRGRSAGGRDRCGRRGETVARAGFSGAAGPDRGGGSAGLARAGNRRSRWLAVALCVRRLAEGQLGLDALVSRNRC